MAGMPLKGSRTFLWGAVRPCFMNWTALLPDRGSDRSPNRAGAREAARGLVRIAVFAVGASLLQPAGFAAATTSHKTSASEKTATKKTTTKKTSTKKKTPAKKPVQAAAKPKHHLATVSSTLLSKADLAALTDAFAEADRKHWSEAMRHARRLSDPVAAKLVLWTRLVSQDSGATLAEIVAFQQQNPDWPRQALLTRRAEEAVLAFPMSDQDVIAWFGAHPPVTGEGRLRYGQVLAAAGRKEEAKNWIQRAWVENDFAPGRQKEILANFRSYLTLATHKARLDRLLWDERTADARLTAALIDANARALADARIKLMTRSTLATDALTTLPSSLKTDPGLLYDQVRYERRRGNDDQVMPLVLTAPNQPHAMVNPDAWWVERKIAARKALSLGQYKEAYEIVSKHGLENGADFADAEFMCGWISLQYLNNASAALAHFARLGDAVSTPISKARAEYWSGRAASANRDPKVAELYYRKAAAYPTTFYGQLGAAALASMEGGTARLHLPKDPKPSTVGVANFDKLELVHAAKLLNDLGREGQTWSFMLHLADILDEPEQVAALSDLALKFGDQKLSLRIAKAASQRNIILPQRAYPVAFMPDYRAKGPTVEKALVYGLSRQESEFDPAAMSPVGARGLMQLMPGTAKIVARQINVPYSSTRLTSDPAYNAMLGSAHLGDLIEGYSGSYIMSIAAYNAGASRVGEWVDQFGDPRSTKADPIDWIENIPFSETRNYVQRVMENTEIYRSRLAGKAEQIRLEADLRRNTGMAITTAMPVPGRIPLASPLIAASAMAPVVEDGETGINAEPASGATTAAVEAATATAVPTPVAPKRTHSKQ